MAAIFRLQWANGGAIFGPMATADDIVNLAGTAVAQPGGAGNLQVDDPGVVNLAGQAVAQPGGSGSLSVVALGVVPTWPAGGTARIGPRVIPGGTR